MEAVLILQKGPFLQANKKFQNNALKETLFDTEKLKRYGSQHEGYLDKGSSTEQQFEFEIIV